MLRHINLLHYSQQIYNAVNNVLKVGKVKTKDLGNNSVIISIQLHSKNHYLLDNFLGGQATTQDFTYAVINAIK